MPNLMRSTVSLAVAGFAAMFIVPTSAPAKSMEAPPTRSAEIVRTGSPAALADLLARYDQLKPGPDRDLLAVEIDKVAGQRYATVSRLYWYTDLAQAEAAARDSQRPILALRMLGRLDEDLSCANSRLFRATLYANTEVSKLLRDNFVLYWSSERPVPRVTIDFGDGRKIESTTTGNSAHYVLDDHGRVLDVLPGLYAPQAFKAELAKSLDLARRVRGKSDDVRVAAIHRYHLDLHAQQQKLWQRVANTPYIANGRRLLRSADINNSLANAQGTTISKSYIEVPQLSYVGHDAGELPDAAMWASIGQVIYGIGDLKPTPKAAAKRDPRRQAAAVLAPRILDDASRALVTKLHGRASGEELARIIERLEHHLIADSALNQLQLRPRIAAEIIQRGKYLTLDALNTWVYANVFHTPKTDTWLGLRPRADFTGLPDDGLSMP